MKYNILTPEYAMDTLVALTQVPRDIWKEEHSKKKKLSKKDEPDTAEFIQSVVSEHGILPDSCCDWDFIFGHVTTSANGCQNIADKGLYNLQEALSDKNSELYEFLKKHRVMVDICEKTLQYNGKSHDVSKTSIEGREGSALYCRRFIGNKLYYDFSICGFLSFDPSDSYAGDVYKRPEILKNIDDLLKTKLASEWKNKYKPYTVIARVKGKDLLCSNCDDKKSEIDCIDDWLLEDSYDISPAQQDVLEYLVCAYECAFEGASECIMVLKGDVKIPPEDILKIVPYEIFPNNDKKTE